MSAYRQDLLDLVKQNSCFDSYTVAFLEGAAEELQEFENTIEDLKDEVENLKAELKENN